MTEKFNVQKELSKLKAQTKAIRKRSYSVRKSRLDKYKCELLELHSEGATIAELQRWLRKNKQCKMAHTSISRWLEKNG